MLRAGIYEMRKGQLPYIPQTLKHSRVDDFHLGFIEIDETVDGISYFLHLHNDAPTENSIRGRQFAKNGVYFPRLQKSTTKQPLLRANLYTPLYIVDHYAALHKSPVKICLRTWMLFRVRVSRGNSIPISTSRHSNSRSHTTGWSSSSLPVPLKRGFQITETIAELSHLR